VAWGGGKVGGASATLSLPQTTSRLASLADFFFSFLVPGYLGPGSVVEEKDKNGVESQVAQTPNMSIGEASALL